MYNLSCRKYSFCYSITGESNFDLCGGWGTLQGGLAKKFDTYAFPAFQNSQDIHYYEWNLPKVNLQEKKLIHGFEVVHVTVTVLYGAERIENL